MFDPIAYINEPRWQESRLGLERIAALLERMGRPQDRLKFVHVAGTNGKGSVCAYLESILRCAGLKTGMFTSPYLMCFEERIRVSGENITLADLREVTLFVREHAEALAQEGGEHPTEFELMTAVAFEHFARSGCDVVVCEVGLGGRLDSTNVIESPEACVITRIGLDHTDLLGSTLPEIAREKAGIVKECAPVISWPQEDDGAMAEIARIAREQGSAVVTPDFSQLELFPVAGGIRPFSYRGRMFATRLLGSYQPSNAALAIEVARELAERGWEISEEAIAQGVARAMWPGRFEVASADGQGPLVVVDGGHNPQGASVLADSLSDVFPGKRIVFVMGVLADKDYRGMIDEVAPLASAFVCVTPPNPRALAAGELARVLREAVAGGSVAVEVAAGFGDALGRARELVGEAGVVCAFGSLYSVSDVKAAL